MERLAAYSGTSYIGNEFKIELFKHASNRYTLNVTDSQGKIIETHKSKSHDLIKAKYYTILKYWITGIYPGIYTVDDWNRDGVFKAIPGQEIQYAIYYRMSIAVKPRQAPLKIASGYNEAFLMGEIYDIDSEGKPIFMAFGSKNGHYYYIGLITC